MSWAPSQTRKPPRILSIAGSDSSGGAGIQADLKTITMLGGYGMTAITAVTAQNTTGVLGVETLPASFIADQIAACLSDIGADAIKIGMVGSRAIANAIERALVDSKAPVVFDPVMVATSGSVLADDETIRGFDLLMSISRVVTPNLPELAALTGIECDSDEAIAEAAELLIARHGCAVLVKGGHAAGRDVTDRLFDPEGRYASFTDPKIDTRHTHGTGCTLSAALATFLGHRMPLEHAVRLARNFTREAISAAPGFGSGAGPMGHQAVRKID
ncbi:bifunctional hydroxymethylpyrimidine kinase/phosphomethylpyrimidine kinase [Erythrobacter litoralis]|uniref:bifunctional hydroxymethylpyrimidine kinase/phosphomethylpyrimidine kinase n=1 Tax=Erythrobacter litoralis TaxID=39960 RepID=UPI002434CA87|nr:bifunctional hydroxymethylpyrimidine kinase/phosphomethylpyrimidine kinase [Erythrobacter litoralis]MDG6077946.1 bifunctional hydroxymethylpyrimidine kinase/phosphomethylpyrimidine kinase [Erythrobacter litoralis]